MLALLNGALGIRTLTKAYRIYHETVVLYASIGGFWRLTCVQRQPEIRGLDRSLVIYPI